jgi:hypothetical protein
MTTYELLIAITAPTAAWAALIALIKCKRAVTQADRALLIAQRALDETASLNAPLLLFSCEMRQDNIYAEVFVTIFNNGNQPTEISAARIVLNQDGYADAQRVRELQNIVVPGRREYLVEFRILNSVMQTGENESGSIDISCEATYTRENQPDAHAYENFEYDPNRRKFMRKIHDVRATNQTPNVTAPV